jgi:DNA-binding transcriptional MerR regulator
LLSTFTGSVDPSALRVWTDERQRKSLPRLTKRQFRTDPISSERLYYRIGEVSQITGLKPHVLRYWESEFRVIRPYKAGSPQRLYRKKDLDLILKIKKLLYEEGFTIAGARKKIRDVEREESRSLRVKAVDNGSEGEERRLLFLIREELQGIKRILEDPALRS